MQINSNQSNNVNNLAMNSESSFQRALDGQSSTSMAELVDSDAQSNGKLLSQLQRPRSKSVEARRGEKRSQSLNQSQDGKPEGGKAAPANPSRQKINGQAGRREAIGARSQSVPTPSQAQSSSPSQVPSRHSALPRQSSANWDTSAAKSSIPQQGGKHTHSGNAANGSNGGGVHKIAMGETSTANDWITGANSGSGSVRQPVAAGSNAVEPRLQESMTTNQSAHSQRTGHGSQAMHSASESWHTAPSRSESLHTAPSGSNPKGSAPHTNPAADLPRGPRVARAVARAVPGMHYDSTGHQADPNKSRWEREAHALKTSTQGFLSHYKDGAKEGGAAAYYGVKKGVPAAYDKGKHTVQRVGSTLHNFLSDSKKGDNHRQTSEVAKANKEAKANMERLSERPSLQTSQIRSMDEFVKRNNLVEKLEAAPVGSTLTMTKSHGVAFDPHVSSNSVSDKVMHAAGFPSLGAIGPYFDASIKGARGANQELKLTKKSDLGSPKFDMQAKVSDFKSANIGASAGIAPKALQTKLLGGEATIAEVGAGAGKKTTHSVTKSSTDVEPSQAIHDTFSKSLKDNPHLKGALQYSRVVNTTLSANALVGGVVNGLNPLNNDDNPINLPGRVIGAGSAAVAFTKSSSQTTGYHMDSNGQYEKITPTEQKTSYSKTRDAAVFTRPDIRVHMQGDILPYDEPTDVSAPPDVQTKLNTTAYVHPFFQNSKATPISAEHFGKKLNGKVPETINVSGLTGKANLLKKGYSRDMADDVAKLSPIENPHSKLQNVMTVDRSGVQKIEKVQKIEEARNTRIPFVTPSDKNAAVLREPVPGAENIEVNFNALGRTKQKAVEVTHNALGHTKQKADELKTRSSNSLNPVLEKVGFSKSKFDFL